MKKPRHEHRFIETDGQIYLVQDGGVWRFPKASEAVPFEVEESGRMDFGDDLVVRLKPRLSYHPEEWFNRDDLFSRSDVDGLVKKAVYMTRPRLVAEAGPGSPSTRGSAAPGTRSSAGGSWTCSGSATRRLSRSPAMGS